MQISIWPEYDDPRVLVIFRGQFADATGFPRDVSFPIPAGAEVNAAAYSDADGRLLSQSWKVESKSDGQVLTYNLPTPSFQVEYYYAGIIGKNARQIEFSTQIPYPVTALAVDIQRPRTATDFQLDPKPDSQSNDAQGFQYGLYSFKDLPANKTLTFKVSYTKTDLNPSVDRSIVQPPADTQPAASPNTTTVTPTAAGGIQPLVIVLATIGLGGLLIVGGVLLIQRRQAQAEEEWEAPARPIRTIRGPANFCTRCGTRLRPGVRFCPECGTKIRVVESTQRPNPKPQIPKTKSR